MPSWIFPSLLVAAILHVAEEYWLPGGFLQFVQQSGTRVAPQLTKPVAVVVNGLFILLALLAATSWRRYPILSLSVAGLMLVNALVHMMGSYRAKKYVPGLITAAVFYVPLSTVAFITAAREEFVTRPGLVIAFGLGLFYHALLLAFLWLGSLRSKA